MLAVRWEMIREMVNICEKANIKPHIYDLDDTPKLDKKKKHTIEVVVDRFKVREDLKTRLADFYSACNRYP